MATGRVVRALVGGVVLVVVVLFGIRWLDSLLIKPFLVPSLPGSAVLITGTSSGLGQASCLYLAEKGFLVYATVRTQRDVKDLLGLWRDEYSSQIRTNGGDIVPIIMDVTSDESVADARKVVVSSLNEKGLKLVGIINNAGRHLNGGVRDVSVDDYKKNFDVNVFGVVRVTRTFLDLLPKGGRIVNVGSVAGEFINKAGVPYGATKHALEAISDSWRRELLSEGISVSLMQPGFIATKMCINPDFCDASALDEFSSAVYHALISQYPLTRYTIGWVKYFPVRLAIWLSSIVSDRLCDLSFEVIEWVSGGLHYWKQD